MNNMEQTQHESQQALELAFQTMKERCKQLEAKLITVEEENISLQKCQEKGGLIPSIKTNETDENVLSMQEKFVELKRQNARLAHHTSMVSTENQQLWRRLTQFIKGNECSENLSTFGRSQSNFPLMTNSESDANRLPTTDYNEKHCGLDIVPLQLTPSKFITISDLNRIPTENYTDNNVKDIGFTYPEDIGTDPTDSSKYLSLKMIQMRETLLLQQTKLVKTLQNLKSREKNGTCDRCSNNTQKRTCHMGTQIDLDCSWKKNGATQTSNTSTAISESAEDNVCPFCGLVFQKSDSFDTFHEHVINHFTKESPNEFELLA